MMKTTGPWTLREIREEHGLTQAAFAEKIGGYKHGVVSAYERGAQIPSDEFLKKVARAFGISTEQILLETEIESEGVLREDRSMEFEEALQFVIRHASPGEIEHVASSAFSQRKYHIAKILAAMLEDKADDQKLSEGDREIAEQLRQKLKQTG